MLSYAFRVAMQLINNLAYREDILRCLVDLYRGLKKPDYVQMCQCLIFLNDPTSVAGVLKTLSEKVRMMMRICTDMPATGIS